MINKFDARKESEDENIETVKSEPRYRILVDRIFQPTKNSDNHSLKNNWDAHKMRQGYIDEIYKHDLIFSPL